MNVSKIQLPNQKETAAGVAGLIAWAIMLGLGYLGINVPVDAQGGIVALVAAIVAKLVPASDQDVLNHVNDTIAQAGVIVGKLTAASDQSAPPTTAAKVLAAKVN